MSAVGRLLAVGATMLCVIGCSAAPEQPTATATPALPDATLDSTASPPEAPTPSGTTPPPPTASRETDPAGDGPHPPFADFGTITLLTPASGGGSRPLLEWEPVESAAAYGVYLYAPDGYIYWGWTGTETSVHVGGEPLLRVGAPGPSVSAGMSWGAVAYDANLAPVAVSQRRPISP